MLFQQGLATEVRDEVDKTNRTIFVGNLSVKTTRQDLKKIFAECVHTPNTSIVNLSEQPRLDVRC
jgi:RNA recognition motif-containing protein